MKKVREVLAVTLAPVGSIDEIDTSNVDTLMRGGHAGTTTNLTQLLGDPNLLPEAMVHILRDNNIVIESDYPDSKCKYYCWAQDDVTGMIRSLPVETLISLAVHLRYHENFNHLRVFADSEEEAVDTEANNTHT